MKHPLKFTTLLRRTKGALLVWRVGIVPALFAAAAISLAQGLNSDGSGSFEVGQHIEASQGTARFTVTNCDTGGPVAGATVTIDGTPSGATATDGTFTVSMTPGMHPYLVSKSGYPMTASGMINIVDNQITNVAGCILGVPALTSNSSTLQGEGCLPPNGAIDPGETVTVSFCIKNNGGGNTANVIGTLLAGGGVTNPDGAKNFGVVTAEGGTACQTFTFTADNVACGIPISARIQLQSGTKDLGTVTSNLSSGLFTTVLAENFDAVSAPALPAGWTTTAASGANLWVTSSSGTPLPSADTAANSAFARDLSTVSDQRLDAPSVFVSASDAQLTFRHNFNFENGFDGGVLEISINGGAFADVLTAGGSFAAGGYTGTISNISSNQSPIKGRAAWTGNSGGFVTAIVNLPAAAAGKPVILRWRLGSDNQVGATGWRVDTINVKGAHTCCQTPPPPLCTVCHKLSTNVTLPCSSVVYAGHLSHGDTVGACATPP